LILVLLGLAIAVAGPAAGLTPITSADLSPDITLVLDGQTIADEDVAEDELLTMTVTTPSLGALPPASALSAYHSLGGGEYLLSFDITVALPSGVTAQPGDVVRWDGANHSIEFDASAESLPAGTGTDAVTRNAATNLVLSFDTTVALGGTTYFDEDLVEFDGANFFLFFDGAAAGIDSALDVDGAHVFPGSGNLALSFDTAGQLGGVDFDDEDVLEVDPSGTTWEMAWDASVERSEWVAGADVNAISFVPEPGQIAMLLAGMGLLTLLARFAPATPTKATPTKASHPRR
jgi:YD repeat-containing protein